MTMVYELHTPDLAEGLASDKPMIRSMSRLVATSYADEIGKWMVAEIDRGSEPGDIFVALANTQAQLAAAFASNFSPSAELTDCRDAYIEVINTVFVPHAEYVAAMAEDQEG